MKYINVRFDGGEISDCNKPKKLHDEYQDALEEAQRLARTHADVEDCIFRIFECRDITVVKMKMEIAAGTERKEDI